MTRPLVLLDLDGTLTDSRPGIVGSIRAAIAELGHTPDPSQDLTWMIGPPPEQVMARALAPYGETRVEEAVAAYRRVYGETGLFRNALYPGIPEMLAALRDAGHDLAVATAKRTRHAVRIIEHFGLTAAFRGVYGTEDDGSLDGKPALLAFILAREQPPAAIMVGDRRYDIAGAHANGLRGIGVAWGYGGVAELNEAGADAIADRPEDLARLVGEHMPR